MIRGFYSAKLGVLAQQENMNLIANNMANVNTIGYKSLKTSFTDLIYQNINRPQADNPAMVGHGVKINKTDIVMTQGPLTPSDRNLDFALTQPGQFFAVQNAAGDIQYTRAGSFIMSDDGDGTYYLAAPNGDRILDAEGEPIEFTYNQIEQRDRIETTEPVLDAKGNPVLDENGAPTFKTSYTLGEPYLVDGDLDFEMSRIGVYTFDNPYGLYLIGDNRYIVTDTSGEPTVVENPPIRANYLEASGVEVSVEMVRVIEASKAFSFNSRMIQVADEVEQTVNNLR